MFDLPFALCKESRKGATNQPSDIVTTLGKRERKKLTFSVTKIVPIKSIVFFSLQHVQESGETTRQELPYIRVPVSEDISVRKKG